MNETKSSGKENQASKIKHNIEKINEEKNVIIKNIIQKDIKNINNKNLENSKKNLNVSQVLLKTLKNTSSIFILSTTTTIINFLCNIPLLRVVSKESFGTVKVYFELAANLINYIPRESIRKTSQKFCPDKDPNKEKQKYIFTSQLNMVLMIFFAIIGIFMFFCFLLFTHSVQLHNNIIQLIIYMICAIVELIGEPVILYMNLKVENKYIAITLSNLSRIISNTILAVFFKLDLWSFTLSRIIGSSVYLIYILYLGLFKYKINFNNFIPKDIYLLFKEKTKNEINIQYLRAVLFQFIRLNILNLIIQNCEGLILSFIVKNTEEEKSDYSFVSKHFSLILRFFIQPINDGFYILVNKIKYMEKKVENKSINININNIINDIKNENNKNIIKENMIQLEEVKNDNNLSSTIESQKTTEIPRNIIENNSKKEEENNNIKEPNIILSIKVLQLFMKIFLFFGIILISYYNLFGINLIELIYGKKWANYNIDKIGDSYSYYVAIFSIFNIVESFSNSTNNSRQMDLSYISLIINSCFLILFMYLFSKWDICGIIMANALSNFLIINCHLFIVFCGKKEKKQNVNESSNSLINEIINFQKNCFISKRSLAITCILIAIGFFIKKEILSNFGVITICIISGIIIILNCCLVFIFEYKQFKNNLEEIELYN